MTFWDVLMKLLVIIYLLQLLTMEPVFMMVNLGVKIVDINWTLTIMGIMKFSHKPLKPRQD